MLMPSLLDFKQFLFKQKTGGRKLLSLLVKNTEKHQMERKKRSRRRRKRTVE